MDCNNQVKKSVEILQVVSRESTLKTNSNKTVKLTSADENIEKKVIKEITETEKQMKKKKMQNI